jgi:hypothetical protein
MKQPTSNALLTLTLCLGLGLTTSGCTWVKKSQGAEQVRIVPADLVGSCKSLGTVSTTTLDKVTVVDRNKKKIQTELETLARNEAVKSGADTLVARSPIIEGRQTFELFRCL